MTEFLELTTSEGRAVSCRFSTVEGISQTLTFSNFDDSTDVDYWVSWLEEYSVAVAKHLLEHVTVTKLSISCTGIYLRYDTGELSEAITLDGKFPAQLTRHTVDLERKVRNLYLPITDPEHYYKRLQETHGSSIAHLENIVSFTMTFLFPLEFNVRGLPSSYRLRRCTLSGHIEFLPYNGEDNLCIMHCLYPGKKPADGKSLNANKEYMAGFSTWCEENALVEDFYIDGFFNLDLVQQLEDRLKINVNFYTFEGKKLELYYRSSYRHVDDPVYHLAALSRALFYDNNKGPATDLPKVIHKPIISSDFLDQDFVAAIGIKNFIPKRSAHCVHLKLSAFATNRSGVVCEYCTGAFSRQTLEAHRLDCRNSFSGNKRERIKVFRDPLPGQDKKEFTRYIAKWKTPYAVYDFEAKAAVGQQHIAYSYSILLLNVFNFGKSVIAINSNHDPEVLLSEFLEDVEVIARNYYSLMNAKAPSPEVMANAEIPEYCPHCLEKIEHVPADAEAAVEVVVDTTEDTAEDIAEDIDESIDEVNIIDEDLLEEIEENEELLDEDYDGDYPTAPTKRRKAPKPRKAKTPEYIFSPFRGDNNKNQHLNGWACASCAAACDLKTRAPLVFYGHNAAKYDQILFTDALLNSKAFTAFSFLPRTESRYSQIGCSLASDTKIKILFADSRMMLGASLSSLAKSWIAKQHTPQIKTLLGLYYPGKDLDVLAEISGTKQVFPYSALCSEELLDSTEAIPREFFRDDLNNRAISESDYSDYLSANSKLKAVIGEKTFTFADFADYYLSVDCITLALVLHNFAETAYALNKIWPLWYVSVSGYSFASLLANNKYSTNPTPTIMIPKAEVQRFLQRSVKGGVSRVFYKQAPNHDPSRDLISYLDVNSLYASIQASKKLPYKFNRWWNLEARSVKSIIDELESLNDSLYHFVEVDIAPLAEEHQEKVSLFPMFAENVDVKAEWLSEDQRYRYSVGARGKEFEGEKINTMTFFEKKNYICSWSYLKFALSLSYEVTAFHRVGEFHSADVMREYTEKTYRVKQDLTAELNKLTMDFKALPEEEQALEKKKFEDKSTAISGKIAVAKIMLCGTFGSTVIRVDKHSDAKLYDTTKDLKHLKRAVSSLRFKSLLHVGGKTVVSSDKSSYTNTSCVSLGSAILWEAKLLLLKFCYSLQAYLKDLGLELIMLYSDTDSVIFHIPDFKDVFESIDELSAWFNEDCYPAFDTRFCAKEFQHPETHEAFCMFKNEVPEGICEFNAVCSKVYSFLTENGKTKLKAKGISGVMQQKYLTNSLYRGVIDGTEVGNNHVCEFANFSQKQLGISTVVVKKRYVSLADLKAWYGSNGTVPIVYGSRAHLEKMAEAKARVEEVPLETP